MSRFGVKITKVRYLANDKIYKIVRMYVHDKPKICKLNSGQEQINCLSTTKVSYLNFFLFTTPIPNRPFRPKFFNNPVPKTLSPRESNHTT